MLETLRCPGCSTRYVIGPARVRPGLRQARCFRCSAVFDIGDAVARLLPTPEAAPIFAPESAPDPAPAPIPAMPPAALPEDTVAGGIGFVSARDAIEKLLGQTPPAPPPPPVRMPSRDDMDVEATLQALDSTLGGAPEPAAEPEPEPQPAPEMRPEPPAPPRLDTASTVKLTSEEIREAMAAASAALAAPAPEPEPPAPEAPPAPELLKVQLEQETTQNVTLDQMSAWIGQGRVQEYHMVARQHSDNWIEAGKVPALRPMFEQARKSRAAQAEEPPKPAPEPPPVKRGLFSGLFGRN